MRIRHLHILFFRSIRTASLRDCGGLNILIGKNNAGKSNILAAIDLLFEHLREASVARPWRVLRPTDQFNGRNLARTLRISAVFDLPEDVADELCQKLRIEAPHLERSIEEVKAQRMLSITLAGSATPSPHLFIESILAGEVSCMGTELTPRGVPLLSLSPQAALELQTIHDQTTRYQSDLQGLSVILRA